MVAHRRFCPPRSVSLSSVRLSRASRRGRFLRLSPPRSPPRRSSPFLPFFSSIVAHVSLRTAVHLVPRLLLSATMRPPNAGGRGGGRGGGRDSGRGGGRSFGRSPGGRFGGGGGRFGGGGFNDGPPDTVVRACSRCSLRPALATDQLTLAVSCVALQLLAPSCTPAKARLSAS